MINTLKLKNIIKKEFNLPTIPNIQKKINQNITTKPDQQQTKNKSRFSTNISLSQTETKNTYDRSITESSRDYREIIKLYESQEKMEENLSKNSEPYFLTLLTLKN